MRHKNSSIPNVTFVILNLVFVEQRDQFLLEGPLSMMSFLIANVFNNPLLFRFAHPEGSITFLPREASELSYLRFSNYSISEGDQ